MIEALAEETDTASLADLVHDLGDVPLARIRLRPGPGSASVSDVERNKGCELIDGTLVEKAMGWPESFLATFLIQLIGTFVTDRKLGLLTSPDGTWRLGPDLVRLPDIAFISWDRLPGRKVPTEAVPRLAPDLAIEILSPGNTDAEMARKRREYFVVGVLEVWMVDRFERKVSVYSSATECRVLGESDVIEGGDILPEFRLPIRQLFAALEQTDQ
jgi:Uma2 family endonuclease